MAGVKGGFLERFLPALLGSLLVIHLAEYIPTASAEDGHCVWYGVCANSTEAKKMNCAYNGPAKKIEAGAVPFLQQYCPDIAAGNFSCCDVEQLKNADVQLKVVQPLLSQCPACWDNFLQHICALTCSPKQSVFLNPIKLEPYGANQTRIAEIDFHITMDYMQETFKSCSQVQDPSDGVLALDVMCGAWGSQNCTPERWFEFMGSSEDNIYLPFQIHFKPSSVPVDGFTPLDPVTRPCQVGKDAEDQIGGNDERMNPQNRRVNPELLRGRALQQALVERLWREKLAEDQIGGNDERMNPQNRRVNPELLRGRALQQALVERLWREKLIADGH